MKVVIKLKTNHPKVVKKKIILDTDSPKGLRGLNSIVSFHEAKSDYKYYTGNFLSFKKSTDFELVSIKFDGDKKTIKQSREILDSLLKNNKRNKKITGSWFVK